MKYYTFLFFTLIILLTACSSSKKTTKKEQKPEIEWLSFEEAMKKAEKKPKKIMVDLYTDWCTWCKVMDNSTFQNPVIIGIINEKFYAVKLDGESQEDISFHGDVYKYKETPDNKRSGHHELAATLTSGRLSYPSIIILNEDRKVIQTFAGFKKTSLMEPILSYFGYGAYKDTGWNEYKESFQSKLNRPTPVQPDIQE